MTEAAIKYLADKEWSMGNGQCPECYGVPASWHGHPCYMTTDTIGHKTDCSLAASLESLGQAPLMLGSYQSNAEFEHFITDGGFSSTRPKTADGCPKWRAMRDKQSVMILGGSMREKVGLIMLEELQRMYPAPLEVFELDAHEPQELRYALPDKQPLHPYGPVHRRGKGKVRKYGH